MQASSYKCISNIFKYDAYLSCSKLFAFPGKDFCSKGIIF